MASKHSERCSSCVAARFNGQLAVKLGWEENAFGVRIKQHLFRIEPAKLRNGLSRDRVSVITSITHFFEREPAVPDSSRLVTKKIKLERQYRICQIVSGIEQQGDALSMFRIDGKVEGLFLLDPRGPQWQRGTFDLLPSGVSGG